MKRKILFPVLLFIGLFLISSCATGESVNPLTGVWKSEDEDYDCTLSFTSDGYYAREVMFDGSLSYCDFGTYSNDDELIETENNQYLYFFDGRKLVIDSIVYSRKSRTARNSSKYIKGVWEDNGNLLAFTSDFAVCSGSGYFLKSYKAEDNKIKMDRYKDDDYLIISSKLYIKDNSNVFNRGDCCIFTRKTSTGKDSASRNILVAAESWHLVDVYNGNQHFIYKFSDNGTYQLTTYSGNSSEGNTYNGTFEFNNNRIELSENTDLNFAIVDEYPFMFTR